jgi:hypothetical protein
LRLPENQKDLVKLALDVIEICRSSQGLRASAYRSYGQWIETGRAAGGLALANLLYAHIDKLQSHLFSPTDLRFTVDYENHYQKDMLEKAEMTARIITREWERRSIDTVFAQGVKEALSYGACLAKLGLSSDPEKGAVNLSARLVMPWQAGVYNESMNGIEDQEAIVETVFLTQYEVWRRIAHLPDAEKLYRRIMAQGEKGGGAGVPNTFMHAVLSTAVLDTSLQNATQPTPGGIVQLTNDPNFATLGPEVQANLIPMHELWVKDDARGDWTTIQIIEPDILVAPLYKRTNLFCPDTLPYVLIQPNEVAGYTWGRSEIVDLMMLQQLLSTTMDDIKRLMGQQFDKLLAFPGYDGMTDELYGQFRSQGYIGMPQGASVTDLTPQLPTASLEYVALIKKSMEEVSGFSSILSGQGESGVRAGNHADTLMRTASPRLRDRSLLVERQCAVLADASLAALEAKDARMYWTDPDKKDETGFLLSQLPEDRRVSVDSHSSSPIYQVDHQNLVAWAVKAGIIGPEDAIEDLNFPNKDVKLKRLKERQAAEAQLIREHPELLAQHGKGKH